MEEKVRQFLEEKFKDGILHHSVFRDQLSVYIKPEYLIDICWALVNDEDLQFNLLADICALDWLGQDDETDERFEVVYNLYSINNKYRFFLKVKLPGDNPEIDSLTSIWNSANWFEREVWDMMGIKFAGHPDLRKILTPDSLEGHPLRKDFPLTYEVPQFSWNKDDPPEVIT
jgi:NADH-quinone oxidoreductase subunit C